MILNEIFINKNLSNWSEIKYNIKHERKIIYNVLIKKDFQKYIDINLKKWKKVSIIYINIVSRIFNLKLQLDYIVSISINVKKGPSPMRTNNFTITS